MTTVCFQCGKVLGEKCFMCGQRTELIVYVQGQERFVCINKNCATVLFRRMEGGITGGLCDRDYEKMVDEMRLRVVLAQGLAIGTISQPIKEGKNDTKRSGNK